MDIALAWLFENGKADACEQPAVLTQLSRLARFEAAGTSGVQSVLDQPIHPNQLWNEHFGIHPATNETIGGRATPITDPDQSQNTGITRRR
jgi:hypothetical protein